MEGLSTQTYLDKGEGAPIILLHGLFGDVGIWLPLAKALVEAGYRVVVPRLPLFDLPFEHTNITYLVRLLHEFAKEHQLQDVTLVGHAVGGQLALFYAHHHPEEVRKTVLISSNGLLDKNANRFSERIDHLDFQSVNRQVERAFFQPLEVTNKISSEIYSTIQDIPRRASLGTLLRSATNNSVSNFLSRFTIPTLLIWGLQDKINTPEVALHFYDLIPNAEVRFLDQCGHVPMLEQPEIVQDLIKQFINKN